MTNIPKVRLGLVAVSRDCFPIELSRKRALRVAGVCRKAGIPITRIPTVVENEKDALKALDELREKKINALVLYLGNFGPETPSTLLAQKFDGPVMVAPPPVAQLTDFADMFGSCAATTSHDFCAMLNV